jgi:periplasmic protein TonB
MRRFAVLSLGLHAALLVGLLAWFRHHGTEGDVPDKEAAVELVMLEQQGTGPPTAPSEPTPAPATSASEPPEPPAPPLPPVPPEPTDTAEADASLPLPPLAPPPASPSPAAPAPPPAQASAPRSRPTAPPIQRAIQAPDINLGGTDSETNAIVFGSNVVPASVDTKFRNKEPIYPPDAVRRAEQGAVILLIHVSSLGLASGVDVLKSSGYVALDRAARDAVLQWHFLPAVKDGQPMPFDMPLRVRFHLE